MNAFPIQCVLTKPFSSIVATELFEELQVTDLSVTSLDKSLLKADDFSQLAILKHSC